MKNYADRIKRAVEEYPEQQKQFEGGIALQKQRNEEKRHDVVLDEFLVGLNAFFGAAASGIEQELKIEAETIEAFEAQRGDDITIEPRKPKTLFANSWEVPKSHSGAEYSDELPLQFTARRGGVLLNAKRAMYAVEIVDLSCFKKDLVSLAGRFNARVDVIVKGDEPHDIYPNEVKERDIKLTELMSLEEQGYMFDIREIEVRLNVLKPHDFHSLPPLRPDAFLGMQRFTV